MYIDNVIILRDGDDDRATFFAQVAVQLSGRTPSLLRLARRHIALLEEYQVSGIPCIFCTASQLG